MPTNVPLILIDYRPGPSNRGSIRLSFFAVWGAGRGSRADGFPTGPRMRLLT